MQTGFLGVGSATRARRAPLSSSPGSSRRLTVSLSLNSTRVGCAAACACVRACVRACKVILDFLRFGHLLSFPVRSLLTWSAHETGRGRYDGRRSAELQHFCGLAVSKAGGLMRTNAPHPTCLEQEVVHHTETRGSCCGLGHRD